MLTVSINLTQVVKINISCKIFNMSDKNIEYTTANRILFKN